MDSGIIFVQFSRGQRSLDMHAEKTLTRLHGCEKYQNIKVDKTSLKFITFKKDWEKNPLNVDRWTTNQLDDCIPI